MRPGPGVRLAITVTAAALMAGCGSSAGAGSTAAPISAPAAESWLEMASGQSGYGVLRTGSSSIVAHTSDGWRTATNVTPPAVPTGGGLSLAVGPGALAVGVDPYERLLTSPLLTSVDGGRTWAPSELPGALSGGRHSVGYAGTTVTAVVSTGRGTLVEPSGDGWRVLTGAAALSTAPRLVIDSVQWAGPDIGWVTGHNPDGGAVAFATSDGGRTWGPVGAVDSSAIAALAPCGAERVWQLPIIDSQLSLRILRTTDDGATWAAGAPLAVRTTSPAWSCQGPQTLVGGSDGRLFSSTDAGSTWQAGPAMPSVVGGLSGRPGGTALAVSTDPASGDPKLWASVDGSAFAAVLLPDWIGKLSAEQVSGS
jgi:photosystem II stability/assembly factor-like uncharacterized protein